MGLGTVGAMRGGIARWKRGVGGQGLRTATAYAFEGVCDSQRAKNVAEGIAKASHYADTHVTRFTVSSESGVTVDQLDRNQLRNWIDGRDPATGEARGRLLQRANNDLLFDATVNTPKSLSIAAMLDDDLQAGLDRLHDRIRNRAIRLWQQEMNARRGEDGKEYMPLAQIEVVELKHDRSRALDPHSHRHMWLNAKVLGNDGRWTSVDSRVLLRFQSIINAEGDIATSSDPEWLALLAAKGLTVDSATGEITELAHLTQPLSRRHQQIELARATRLAQWHDEHPGMTPSPAELRAIDQWAWAHGRPDKPRNFDELSWRDTVLDEIRALDRVTADNLTNGMPSVMPPLLAGVPTLNDSDIDRFAVMALAQADQRAMTASARFAEWDVRAAVMRVIAAQGFVTHRDHLDSVIDTVTCHALDNYVTDLSPKGVTSPAHVRRFVKTDTAMLKNRVDAGLAQLARRPVTPVAIDDALVEKVAKRVTEHGLDEAQRTAAKSVASTDALVTVVGPAGAGKTSMLTVARHLLQTQKRRMMILAPTKKAATVVARETGSFAFSIHALLHQAGWRWYEDDTGRTRWHRLQPGAIDPQTDRPWKPKDLHLGPDTTIVIDEAGMVDLHAAAALTELAAETGVRLAWVGDPEQIQPVGHSGAMLMAQRHATSNTELHAVHRFRNEDGTTDVGWAELSKRLRVPKSEEDATEIAAELVARDRVHIVDSDAEATLTMVNAWLDTHGAGQTAAVVVSTNEEAQSINDAIQQERIARNSLCDSTTATGIDGQRLLVGDIVQTRRNDRDADVENRALWRVTKIAENGIELESQGTDKLRRTITHAYAAQAVHLGYATTAHGVQGETVHRAIVGPGVSAAGLYVGLTRGKRHNECVVVASNPAAAQRELVEQMMHGQTEATLDESREAVAREIDAASTELTARGIAPQPWHKREHGRVIDLAQAIETAAERIPHSRDQMQALQDEADRLDHARVEMARQLAVTMSTSDLAERDGRPLPPPPIELLEVRAELARVRDRLDAYTRENLPHEMKHDALVTERNIRELVLSPERAAEEEHARLGWHRRRANAAIEQTRANTPSIYRQSPNSAGIDAGGIGI